MCHDKDGPFRKNLIVDINITTYNSFMSQRHANLTMIELKQCKLFTMDDAEQHCQHISSSGVNSKVTDTTVTMNALVSTVAVRSAASSLVCKTRNVTATHHKT